MDEVSIIGADLAKSVFQPHGARANGSVAFRRKLRRAQLLAFLAGRARCVVTMEACATSHHWGRVAQAHGHEARLIPPVYVKPNARAPEERRRRRGGGVPPRDAVRGGEERREAGGGAHLQDP